MNIFTNIDYTHNRLSNFSSINERPSYNNKGQLVGGGIFIGKRDYEIVDGVATIPISIVATYNQYSDESNPRYKFVRPILKIRSMKWNHVDYDVIRAKPWRTCRHPLLIDHFEVIENRSKLLPSYNLVVSHDINNERYQEKINSMFNRWCYKFVYHLRVDLISEYSDLGNLKMLEGEPFHLVFQYSEDRALEKAYVF